MNECTSNIDDHYRRNHAANFPRETDETRWWNGNVSHLRRLPTTTALFHSIVLLVAHHPSPIRILCTVLPGLLQWILSGINPTWSTFILKFSAPQYLLQQQKLFHPISLIPRLSANLQIITQLHFGSLLWCFKCKLYSSNYLTNLCKKFWNTFQHADLGLLFTEREQ